MRAEIDQGMKADIRRSIGVAVVALHDSLHRLLQVCSRRRSIGVMLIAASRAQVASISAMAREQRFELRRGHVRDRRAAPGLDVDKAG